MAWVMWQRGVKFRLMDRGTSGSSRVAAGMINPITGKNFAPSWRIAEFLPEALSFYAEVEKLIARQIWYPLPVLRLAESEREWAKIRGKISSPEVLPWIKGDVAAPDGWAGAIELQGGGRVDVLAFLEGSREFFTNHGCYEIGEVASDEANLISCDGAAGLMANKYGPHRCAKGEILIVKASDWDQSRIRVGAGGWIVPITGGLFKAGSTYEWQQLDDVITENGKQRVEAMIRKLAGNDFEIVGHEAGIRPILRRSQPLIGPVGDTGWMLNALGSKGALYASGMATRLGQWIYDRIEPEPEVDLRVFLQQTSR